MAKTVAAAFGRMQLSTLPLVPAFTSTARDANTALAQLAVPQWNLQMQQSNAEKWVIILRLPGPAAVTDASRATHQNNVGQWHANNPRAKAATEDRPYPLTLGTALLGSGECTGCRRMGHMESGCMASTRLMQIETKWCRKVDSI
ncbi:hypothetical protein C0991_010536 [Blastosporella zonata]|nr:hypothetical protein C0991_010536 [Blastosporella zonata]